MSKTKKLSKEELLDALHELILKGDLLVWDPKTKELHGSEAIDGVCLNGSAIQICLTEKH